MGEEEVAADEVAVLTMMSCYYQCPTDNGVLLIRQCPTKWCPTNQTVSY